MIVRDIHGAERMAFLSHGATICWICHRCLANGEYYTQHYIPAKGQRTVLFPICTKCFEVKPGSNGGKTTTPLHIADMETQVMLPIVRTNTPRPAAFKKVVLVTQPQKEKPTFTTMIKKLMKKGAA